ncbi:hypothetical protein BBH99_13810 [Chryseobacterium contaminans]|uniref:HNH endonuclease n=1 Tax=Chryseobacterium contaminans TaxID=1423959 RepID=A0A1M7BZD6_9FLAO|nr:HNH endonuclease [Chryseobacterium contaminans]OCA71058.1 hypothetical protein BBH99_13810 [Chryseobacterium contaminans]SHL59949.1 HNH endonuclease [Chryseobacterium contaminans]
MTNYFNEICEFRQNHPIIHGETIKTDDPLLNNVKEALNSFKSELEKKYGIFNNIHLTVKESKGATNFPHITHVCILPPNQKVSNGIYVAICFDKKGKGAVVGCAESKTNPKGLNIKIRKSKSLHPRIDVDGGGDTTKYNNVFENPKEFYYKLENESDLEKHIKRSLILCFYNLGLIKESEYLQTADYLDSSINESEISYFNIDSIQDDRKKIAIQIYARRGQKKFREKLINAYNKKCAITQCEIIEMLEAAHIYSFKGSDTNKTPNGILLRSDIHTLFDLGLISIDPENYTIYISNKISHDEYYAKLHQTKISLPAEAKDYPSSDSLKHHFENIFDK